MERVLIVAKTRMNNLACVGGLAIDTNRSVRLLHSNGMNQQANTRFEIGQIWELDFHPASQIVPPRVEDVIVTKERFVGQQADLATLLRQKVQPWKGGTKQLFDGLLTIDRRSAYISESTEVPQRSTGYWLPNKPLDLTQKNDKSYYQIKYETHNHYQDTLSIAYVGFANPIQQIPANTLIRLSLARWRMQLSGAYEGRCYLQLSGWYQ